MLKRPVAAIAAPSVGDGHWRRIEHINALTRLARKSKSVAPNSKIASNFPFYVCCPKQPLHFQRSRNCYTLNANILAQSAKSSPHCNCPRSERADDPVYQRPAGKGSAQAAGDTRLLARGSGAGDPVQAAACGHWVRLRQSIQPARTAPTHIDTPGNSTRTTPAVPSASFKVSVTPFAKSPR